MTLVKCFTRLPQDQREMMLSDLLQELPPIIRSGRVAESTAVLLSEVSLFAHNEAARGLAWSTTPWIMFPPGFAVLRAIEWVVAKLLGMRAGVSSRTCPRKSLCGARQKQTFAVCSAQRAASSAQIVERRKCHILAGSRYGHVLHFVTRDRCLSVFADLRLKILRI